MITDSDMTPAYEPFDSCEECGSTIRDGKCPVCDEDYFYEQDRMWEQENAYRAAEDASDVLREIARANNAFLDMTPWGPGPALGKRQAD